MIVDGYNRFIHASDSLGKESFVYRPATRGERDSFRHTLKFFSHNNIPTMYTLAHWMSNHVVESTCRKDPNSIIELSEKRPEIFSMLRQAIQGLVVDSSGKRWIDEEIDWQINLREGVKLLVLNPKLANRSCDSCKKFWYSEVTGDVLLVNSTGKPMLRDGPAPCETETKCLKGTPEKQRSLNRANRWAYQHFLECDATGNFPNDPIVTWNAVIIRSAMKSNPQRARVPA